MSVWLIEPLDPLIARDGRPAAVGRFSTVGFPYPSMTAGAVRTRMGSEGGAFVIPKESLGELTKKVIVRGPLLAEMEAEKEEVFQWLAPAPQDAVFLRDDAGKVNLKRLVPQSLTPGEAMDSLPEKHLMPLRFQGGETYGKPPDGIPAFWNWKDFEAWLGDPKDHAGVELPSLGAARLPVETRAHLAIQPGERVGIDGMLFQTAGLRFLQSQEKDGPSFKTRRFALSVWCQGGRVAGRELALKSQIAPLGGERRLARWSPASQGWPEMPAAIREKIVETGCARLVLLTPAVFERGALPGWNGSAWPLEESVQVTVRAAAVQRPEVVSGWDLAADNGVDAEGKPKPKGRPKPSRRLAPAGSVYFVELTGSPEDRRRWCDATWLACVSDGEQDRRDGFGLVALGTWEDKE